MRLRRPSAPTDTGSVGHARLTAAGVPCSSPLSATITPRYATRTSQPHQGRSAIVSSKVDAKSMVLYASQPVPLQLHLRHQLHPRQLPHRLPRPLQATVPVRISHAAALGILGAAWDPARARGVPRTNSALHPPGNGNAGHPPLPLRHRRHHHPQHRQLHLVQR